MARQYFVEPIVVGEVDGPTLTAAAAASCIPAHAKATLSSLFWDVGRKIRIKIKGRISVVVTTPGTARFDVRMGSTVVWDSGALNLNVVAKTNVPFEFEVDLVCRTIGQSTSATLEGVGKFTSEAVVGAAANTAGGNGALLCPVGNPAAGSGFDSTVANTLDVFFTQTVATGSLTVVDYHVESIN